MGIFNHGMEKWKVNQLYDRGLSVCHKNMNLPPVLLQWKTNDDEP